MVICQSANQLKTPAKVSWAFKMVSQFGSLGYTIMGKTADQTVVQKTIINKGELQTLIAKEAGCSQSAVSKHVNRKLSGRKKCGRKRCTTNWENRNLWVCNNYAHCPYKSFLYFYVFIYWIMLVFYVIYYKITVFPHLPKKNYLNVRTPFANQNVCEANCP